MDEYEIDLRDVGLDLLGNIIVDGAIEYPSDPDGVFPLEAHVKLSLGRLRAISVRPYSGAREHDLAFYAHQPRKDSDVELQLNEDLSRWVRSKVLRSFFVPENSWRSNRGLTISLIPAFKSQSLSDVRVEVSYGNYETRFEFVATLKAEPIPGLIPQPEQYWPQSDGKWQELKLNFSIKRSAVLLLFGGVGHPPKQVPYERISVMSGNGQNLSLARLWYINGRNVIGYCEDDNLVSILNTQGSHRHSLSISRFSTEGKEVFPRLYLECLSLDMIQSLLRQGNSPKVEMQYSGAETGYFKEPTEERYEYDGGYKRERRIGALTITCRLTRCGLEIDMTASGYEGADVPTWPGGTKSIHTAFVVPWEGVIAHLPRLAHCRSALLENAGTATSKAAEE